jgi:hypothetical protein
MVIRKTPSQQHMSSQGWLVNCHQQQQPEEEEEEVLLWQVAQELLQGTCLLGIMMAQEPIPLTRLLMDKQRHQQQV